MKEFSDALDTAVITTIHVVRQKSPIIHVFHFDDGYWQFSGVEENLPDEEFLILRLDEVIALDPSVLEVADLPYGCSASRENVLSEWIFSDVLELD